MEYATTKERDEALIALQEEEPPKDNIDAWAEENKKKQEEIFNATIAEEPAEPPKEPVEPPPEPGVPPKPAEPPVDEVITFKRVDLPEVLQPYKDGDEIIKQAAHARDYANRSEEQLKSFETENTQLKEAQKTLTEKLEAAQTALENKVSITPPSPEKRIAESQLESLNESLSSLKGLDDGDYIEAGKVRKVLDTTALELGNAVSTINQLKEEAQSYKKDFADFKTVYETDQSKTADRNKATELDRYHNNMIKGIGELQKEHPELKTSKPVMSEANDGLLHQGTVGYDVFKFGSRILSSKFGNNNPDWDSVNAVVNAYLRKDPGIVEYCGQNAITPESVGTTQNDIEVYSIINNVDATMVGQKIDEYTGERRQLVSPFNKNPINYPSYVKAYEALKSESGITQKELQILLNDREKLGQKALDEALGKKAEQPKSLGSKGEASPEDIGHDMTKEVADKIIKGLNEYIDFEDQMEADAQKGNRRRFHLYNKACKVLGHQPAAPSPYWPAEKTA